MEAFKQFISSIENAILTKNWYAALCVALIMPDVCGKVEYPNEKNSGRRYVNWFNANLLQIYTRNSDGLVLLSGEDFYALRCAFLHHGSNDISDQKIRKSLDLFRFVIPPSGCTIHRNLSSIKSVNKLQLQVDLFCGEIIEAAKNWAKSKSETEIESVIDCKIEILGNIFSFF